MDEVDRRIPGCARERARAQTSACVRNELVHRYTARGRRAKTRQGEEGCRARRTSRKVAMVAGDGTDGGGTNGERGGGGAWVVDS